MNFASATNTLSPRPSTSRAADLAGLGAVGGVGAGVAVGAEAFDLLDDGGMPLQVQLSVILNLHDYLLYFFMD